MANVKLIVNQSTHNSNRNLLCKCTTQRSEKYLSWHLTNAVLVVDIRYFTETKTLPPIQLLLLTERNVNQQHTPFKQVAIEYKTSCTLSAVAEGQ